MVPNVMLYGYVYGLAPRHTEKEDAMVKKILSRTSPPANNHMESIRIKKRTQRKTKDTADSTAHGRALRICYVLNYFHSYTLRSLQRAGAKSTEMLPEPKTLDELRITN